MTTINLAIRKHEEAQVLVKIRRVVKSVTTVCLVVYIVSMAGVTGWWWYTNARTASAGAELEDLLAQVTAKSEAEAVVRRLIVRAGSVQTFLDSRVEVGGSAGRLAGAVLVPMIWNYDSTKGVEGVVVNAAGVAQIDEFVADMAEDYANVRLESVKWSSEGAWVGTLSLGGKK